MHSHATALVALALVAAAFNSASAAQQGQIYVRGDVGYVFGDSSIDGEAFASGSRTDHGVETDGGWRGGAAFGYLIEDDLRIEAEISYADRDTDSGSLAGLPLTTVSGSVSALMVTANLVYDIPHKLFGAQPFVSGGVGIICVDADYISSDAATIRVDDTDTVAAGKIAVGFAYPVAQNIEATFAYQYAGTFNDLTFPGGPAVGPPQGIVKLPYGENSVSLGVRYTF